MAFDPHANLAYSLVAVAPSPAASGTSLTLSAGDGALFPDPAGIGYEVTVWPIATFPLITNAEIVRVTAKVGDVLTIVRTQGGTSARSILVGDQIALTVTKKVIEDLETAFQTPLAVSAGASSASLSALTFSNSNGVSFGLNAGTITATVKTDYQTSGAYLTTAALSQDSSKYAGTNGAITGGSITVNTSGVSVNLPAYLTTAMASNRGSDFVQATAVFAGTNASGTIASGGISVSVNSGGGDAIRGIAAGGSTATTNTVNFSNANGVSFGFGAAGNSTVLTASVSQSNQSAIKALGASNTGNTAGNTGVSTGIDWVFAGTNNITVSQSTAVGGPNTLWMSGPTVGGAQTGISGVVVSDTTYTSGTISFSNAGNITIASSVNGATQYVRLSGNAAQTIQSAIKGFGVSNTGQTAGDTGISTGIDWVLAGSQSITLSQSTAAGGPDTVWFQHPAWLTTAMQSNAATLSNIRVSAGTTSNLLSALTFKDTNGVSWGIDASTITATVKTDYLTSQSTQFLALTLGGNSAGTSTFHASNNASLFFHGGNNITLSGNGSTVTISGPNVGGAQTGISGIVVSDTTYTSGTVSFSNAGNITISSSVNGATQYIRLSGNAAQTNQSAIKGFGVSNTGQTAGNTGISTGIDWVIAGSQSITLSQSTAAGGPDTVWIQHPAWLTTAMQSNAATLSNIRVSAGTTSNLLSALTFKDTNGVSWGIDASTITATVKTDYLTSQSTQYLAMTLGGNTAGTTTFHATNNASLFFNGGNNITLSGNGSTVTISAVNQTNQSAIKAFGVSNTGNTAGNTGVSTGIDWVIAGSGNITASESTTAGGPNTVWLSVPTAANGIAAVYDGANSISSGTIRFTNANNISFTINGQTVSGSVAAPIPIATAVKAVASIGSTGTITRYAPEDHQHAGVAAFAVTNTGNTAGDTRSQVGTLYLAASGNITASQSTAAAGNDTVWLSVPAQSNQTLGLYMSSNTTSSVSSGTVDARSLTFRGMGIASVGYSNGEVVLSVPSGGGGITNINVSAGTTSNNLSNVTFADSNGVSWGLNASTITASVSTYNTVGTATTVKSVASANSVGTVTRWAAEDHAHAGIGAIGISTSGNTSGTTGSVQGTYWFEGGNNVTVSQITSNNGSHTLVISARNQGTASYYANLPSMAGLLTGASAITQTSGSSMWIQPFQMPYNLSVGWLRLLASWNDSAVGTGGTPVVNSTFSVERYTTFGVMVFSQGSGANSRSIRLMTSTSEGMTGRTNVGAGAQSSRYTVSIEKSYPVSGTTSSYTSSYAVSSASIVISSNSNTLFTGPAFLDLRFGVSLSPGNYWLGIGMSTNTSTQSGNISFATSAGIAMSLMAVSNSNISVGVIGAATSASDHQLYPGLGMWSTNSSKYTTDSIGINSISQLASNPQLPFQFMRQA